MAQIRYLAGDATSPQAKGAKIIAHICNDQGRWGKGFVLAVSRRWAEPGSGPPIRYAVRLCLPYLAGGARDLAASVHLPRIGCGLAGGRWDRIEPLIISELVENGVPVTV